MLSVMRRWGLASFLSVLLLPLGVSAQEAEVVGEAPADDNSAPNQSIAYGAMPGGLHAPSAETLPKGAIQISTLSGIGRRTGLLGPDHKFNRAIGDLAFAYGVLDILSIGLSLDGRYDRHWGLAPTGDDGYVGDPHLIIRAGKSTGSLILGGQLGVWVPGKDAPSVAGSAISVDARVLVSLPAGPGLLSFSGGFRFDNSVKSVDDPMKLSLQDRVSLGVSDYNAAFGAVQLNVPIGQLWVAPEASLDVFIGGPPDPDPTTMEIKRASLARSTLIFRGGLTAGYHITDQFSALVFLEAAKVPGINTAQVLDANIPLIPYEPMISGGIGLQARFGVTKKDSPFVGRECERRIPPDCPDIKVTIYTIVTGKVVDNTGKPIAGAKIKVALKNSQLKEEIATDEKGEFKIEQVPIGNRMGDKETIDETAVEITAELPKMKSGKQTIAKIEKGTNTVPPITLEPELPPGQLRGVVRSLPGGKAVEGATITVSPGDAKTTSAGDGTFSIDLAPGQYKIKVSKGGLRDQELEVTVPENGVAIKNIEMQK